MEKMAHPEWIYFRIFLMAWIPSLVVPVTAVHCICRNSCCKKNDSQTRQPVICLMTEKCKNSVAYAVFVFNVLATEYWLHLFCKSVLWIVCTFVLNNVNMNIMVNVQLDAEVLGQWCQIGSSLYVLGYMGCVWPWQTLRFQSKSKSSPSRHWHCSNQVLI